MFAGGLGGLGGHLGMEILSEAVFANFGRPRIVQNLSQMARDGAKLELRWQQDGQSLAIDGHFEATSGAILAILICLGGGLCKTGRNIKTSSGYE